MKKLITGLAVLLAGFASNSLAAFPTGNDSPCAVVAPNYGGGFTFGLAGLWWRATSPQQNFAVTFDNFDPVFFEGFGQAHDHLHNFDNDWGFQANIGYIFPCSANDVRLTYTRWDSNDHQNVRDGFIVTPGQFDIVALNGPTLPFVGPGLNPDSFPALLSLATLISAPGFVFNDAFSRISSRLEIKNPTWDLDFGQTINVGCNFGMRWFAGLRYSHLEKKVDTTIATTFTGEAGPEGITIDADAGDLIPLRDFTIVGTAELDDELSFVTTDFFHHRSKFIGVGPRFGFDIDYHLACCFGIVGSLSTSLLVGEVNNTFAERNTLTGTFAAVSSTFPNQSGFTALDGEPTPLFLPPFEANFATNTGLISFHQPNETRIVPNIDAKLGLEYSYSFCNCPKTKVTLEAGYYVSHYFNAVDRSTDFGFDALALGDLRAIDLNFEGPYISIQVAL